MDCMFPNVGCQCRIDFAIPDVSSVSILLKEGKSIAQNETLSVGNQNKYCSAYGIISQNKLMCGTFGEWIIDIELLKNSNVVGYIRAVTGGALSMPGTLSETNLVDLFNFSKLDHFPVSRTSSDTFSYPDNSRCINPEL
ncbi:MAG: hypothetical protein HOO06_08310 [Bdellovibrionaceae bacterium]|jgi:hypothetical protein|nr:hypothetical protein [Pseudobdellovibrionaceae bacterium]